jgi:hypothetical protein
MHNCTPAWLKTFRPATAGLRFLLVLGILFAAQSSLFATVVFRYEWLGSNWPNPDPAELPPVGSEWSGYIDFRAPRGLEQGLDAI